MKQTYLVSALLLFALSAFAEDIHCPGAYDGHLQGIAVDAHGSIYWSFTVALVKTASDGTLLQQIVVPGHHGDLWVEGDMVYVVFNQPASNGEPGARDSWICAYKTDDLSSVWKKEVPEVVRGAGGLAMHNGHFFVVSGRLWKGHDESYVYEYDGDCVFLKRHLLRIGNNHLGIQTMAYADGAWWFGCYGNPPKTVHANEDFSIEREFDYDCSLGIAPAPGGGFYIGHGKRNEERKNVGWLIRTDQPGTDEKKALQ